MYDKILKSDFDVLEHLNTKSKEKIESNIKKVHTRTSFISDQKESLKRKVIKQTYSQLKYTDFLKVNELHNEYIKKIKSTNFLQILYKAELTGALLKFKTISGIKEGIVVEERKNSFLIIHSDDSLKVYPKQMYDFVYKVDGIRYFILGKFLKYNRFFKK
ncbi:hypothetical protein TUBRATIS_009220 [Tubulinosema ratisbonensis]|uniref:Uncharacterized protein n=1 Tax=Tubulinosema ratisbonensis TaxID=291195 RepID=A0A437AND4_9MICR|nr:hypothetical protein TUBRATIS_009220 [Tubulinosema ratisbonensis]